MNQLREGLPDLPSHMRSLAISDKGYPIPWFVRREPDGSYDFRVMDSNRLILAYKFRRCWVCGGTLGRYMTFVIGPMCVVNRTSAEPPSHYECAKFSATACPFLTLPKSQRREANMPGNTVELPGHMITRNPGVTCLWTVRGYGVNMTPNGPLFDVSEAESVEWYAEKQHATREQIMASVDSGMKILRELAQQEGAAQQARLGKAYEAAMKFIPPSPLVVQS